MKLETKLQKSWYKRKDKILGHIKKGETYLSIAKKFKITKQRVAGIAKDNGIQRQKDNRQRRKELYRNFIVDIRNNMQVDEVAVKHGITISELRFVYKTYSGKNLVSTIRERRNADITTRFIAGSTASAIINKETKVLVNPIKIDSVRSVYDINTKAGVKRYPQVGNRSAGGTFQSKRDIKFIINKRDKHGWSLNEVVAELTRKGRKTVTGLDYIPSTVSQLYNKFGGKR